MKKFAPTGWFKTVSVVSSALVGGVIISSSTAIAQSAPAHSDFPSLTLLPLKATSFEMNEEERALDAVANDVNTQVDINIALSEEVEGLTWEQIPVVRDFVNEEGDVDMSGGALPISVSVSNFMEAYGVVVSTDFKVR